MFNGNLPIEVVVLKAWVTGREAVLEGDERSFDELREERVAA